MTSSELTLEVIREGLMLTLLSSGAAKTADISVFTRTLVALKIPKNAAKPLALLIIAAELTVGVAGTSMLAITFISDVMSALFLLFVPVNVLAWLTRPTVKCRCFGALGNSQFGSGATVRSLILASLSVLVPVFKVAPPQAPSPVTTALLVVSAVLLVMAISSATQVVRSIGREA